MAKNTDFNIRLNWIEPQLCYFLAVCPQSTYLTSSTFSFSVCKRRIITTTRVVKINLMLYTVFIAVSVNKHS